MRLDPITLAGVVFAFAAILVGISLEGGELGSVIQGTAFLIVLGGGLGATMASFSMDEIKQLPGILKSAFTEKSGSSTETIKLLVDLADKARREGLLVLEQKMKEVDDAFLKKGIQLVVDGNDATVVRNILETELANQADRHHVGASVFETMGGFLPTIGILGTVLGLIHALENLDDPSAMGPAIAVAFIATLYGVGFANLIFLPIANKLKRQSQRELLVRELVIEGVISIQAGSNPRVVEEKLHAFLAPSSREKVFETLRG